MSYQTVRCGEIACRDDVTAILLGNFSILSSFTIKGLRAPPTPKLDPETHQSHSEPREHTNTGYLDRQEIKKKITFTWFEKII